MEFDGRLPSAGVNVVYLSSLFGKGGDFVAYHRCNHACQVEHVWANLYRCLSTGSSHVCDKNCNQRILYDNNSSICRVSGQIFPLSPAEQEAASRATRRKRDSSSDGLERSIKRRCESPNFESRLHQIAVPASGQASAMDLS